MDNVYLKLVSYRFYNFLRLPTDAVHLWHLKSNINNTVKVMFDKLLVTQNMNKVLEDTHLPHCIFQYINFFFHKIVDAYILPYYLQLGVKGPILKMHYLRNLIVPCYLDKQGFIV